MMSDVRDAQCCASTGRSVPAPVPLRAGASPLARALVVLVATALLVGVVAGVEGLFRSDDSGSTWIRINDALHGFGQMRTITGDPRIFGRVYFGTGGRGIVFGDIAR